MWWELLYSKEELASLTARDESIPLWGEDGEWNPMWQYDTWLLVRWTVALACFFTVARFVLIRFVLRPIGERYVLAAGYSEEHVVKFCESGVRLSFYLPSSIALIWIAATVDWFTKPWEMWFVGLPPEPLLEALYLAQIGWYAHSVFAHVFLDKHKDDFIVMTSHHVATFLLLFASFKNGYYRVGFFVLFSHDPCDPFLELSKMFNYMHLYLPGIFAFVGLVTSWIFFRLFFFPTTSVYSATYHGPNIVGTNTPGYWWCLILLYFLQVLHVYWFVLICRVGLNVCRGRIQRGVSMDLREDKNDQKQQNGPSDDIKVQGDKVQGDKVQGDKVQGDKVQGDKLLTKSNAVQKGEEKQDEIVAQDEKVVSK